ncbi:MAG TPA: IS21 family transposase [Bryobacteraceae bacterium]|nr:IS21 family transposase [Bryobacteraceae bacterium]
MSMRKTQEVLRLHYELKLGQRQIARSCGIGQSTVHDCLKRARAAGVSWPLPPDWNQEHLEQALYGTASRETTAEKTLPDFAAIQHELQTHAHLTLLLVWQEYRETNPSGYGYSRFCELYLRWRKHLDVVLRQEHIAGEKVFVDYAGATIPIHGPDGAVRQAALFVAVLGASNYTYAEATESQQLHCWLGSHIRAFEFFGGVPKIAVPDNLKSGVDRACRYEPDLNRSYQEMAEHYRVAVIPARRRKPRDKAKVEAGVQVVQRWIVAALRHHRFFSLEQANEAIGALLEKLNQRPFRKREGCRASLFAELDRPALQPLPGERYEFAEWSTARVNIDYHVELDRHYYSVPYTLTGQQVEIRATLTSVEILRRGQRVASHRRDRRPYLASTQNEHRPKSHQRHLEWTPSRLVSWAQTVGPQTARLFARILESKKHPEMGYRSCLGLLRLGKTYTHPRLEAAAQRALATNACSYRSVKSMLDHGLDSQPLETPEPRPPLDHNNIRGASYFDPSVQ